MRRYRETAPFLRWGDFVRAIRDWKQDSEISTKYKLQSLAFKPGEEAFSAFAERFNDVLADGAEVSPMEQNQLFLAATARGDPELARTIVMHKELMRMKLPMMQQYIQHRLESFAMV